MLAHLFCSRRNRNTVNMYVYFLILFMTLIFVIHLYYRYNRGGYLIGKIRGPKQMFFFGNVWDICSSQVGMFNNQLKWRQMYGDFFRVCGFHYRSIYIYKPEDVETILSTTRFIEKNFPYIFFHRWLGEGLLTSNGKKWQHRRKLLTPAFHFTILKKFFRIICEHTADLMESIKAEVESDETELMPLISKQTLRAICETAMGIGIEHKDKGSLFNKYFSALNVLSKCLLYRSCRLWLFNDFLYNLTETSRVERKAVTDLHKFTTKVIQERRKLRNSNQGVYNDNNGCFNKSKFAMLDILLAEEQKGNIDEAGIREEVDTFTFEGHDTTSKALSFMIMRIANEPEIQNSIYEELQSIFRNSQRASTLEDINQMKYLECCIKESLRIYPSVSFFSRYIVEEIDMSGYRVPKNTFCNINVFDIHRNPEVFPEPENFIPERFLPENMSKIHPYAYIPFSAGPRNCIGQKFAMMEMKTVMSSLLWRYKLEPVTKHEDLVFQADIVLTTRDPIYVRFRDRCTE